MKSKRIILILGVVLVIVAGISIFGKKGLRPEKATLASPTPELAYIPTGTFVDGLVGEFTYFKADSLFHVTLPKRTETQIAGLGDAVIAKFPHVRPAWSNDGSRLAVLLDGRSIAVVDFTTGDLVQKISLEFDLSRRIDLSFSADDRYLLVKTDREGKSSLGFFEIATGKQILNLDECVSNGVWMAKAEVYATACKYQGASSIMIIDPATKDQISKLASGSTYTFINEYDSSNLLVMKGILVGKMDFYGKFTALNAKSIPDAQTLKSFSDLPKALAEKIQTLKHTDPIADLVISPSNTFALYTTAKGIWVIDLPIKSDPYFLFPGDLPSIRPI